MSGTDFDEMARVFYLKRQKVAGAEIADDAAAGLSAQALIEIGDFDADLVASQSYMLGLGQDELGYVSADAGLSAQAKLRRAAAAAGASSVDFYYTANLGLGDETCAYLQSLSDALLGFDNAASGGLATEALSLLGSSLDSRPLELQSASRRRGIAKARGMRSRCPPLPGQAASGAWTRMATFSMAPMPL